MSVYRLPLWCRKFLCTFSHGFYRRLYFPAPSKVFSLDDSLYDEFEEVNW